MRSTRLYFFLLFLATQLEVVAQNRLLHQDPEMFNAIRQGLHHVYNFEFEQSQPYFLEIKKKYPQHPAYSFSQALTLFTKNFPIKPGHPEYKLFDYYVNDCLKKSSLILKNDPNNADGIFCHLSAQSYQALMFSLSKDYLHAVGSAKKVYALIKQGIEVKKEYPDFYFSSGMFYYYADQFPETHPMAKPLMLFFENGNKEKGLNELNISMLRGVYTKQESAILLGYVYLKYENKPEKSLEYSEKFYFNYPNNPFALARYMEGLLFTKNYLKTKELLPKLQASKSDFFKVVAEVYAGILEEEYANRPAVAKQNYLHALKLIATLPNKTDDLQSFCYLGLGRISDKEKDRKKAILYYHKALNIAEYEVIKKECEQRLQNENRSLSKH